MIIQDVNYSSKNKLGYVPTALPYPLSKRKRFVSVIDLHEQSPLPTEFRRPKRTTRSVSPSSTFRHILPLNSQHEQESTSSERISSRSQQKVPIKVPMYNENYL